MAGNSPNTRPEFEGQFEKEKFRTKFLRKSKENPIFPGALSVGTGILFYMLWGLTHRKPGEKLSVYLIHTRLAAQGAIVGILGAAMSYQIYK